MHALRCLNCDAPLTAAQVFCSQCSQRTDTARLSIRDVLRELMHSFVNVERGPIAFAKALLTQPGIVARDYVQGRRRRHYGPFATLVVVVGVTALLVNVSDYRVLAHDGLPARPTELLQRHFNLLLLMQLPLLSGICALVFRSARLTLPEHAVLIAYTLSIRAVVLGLIASLSSLGSTPEPTALQVWMFWAAWYVYFGWAASQFYPGHRGAVALRGMFGAALGHGAVMVLILLGGSAYQAMVSDAPTAGVPCAAVNL